MIALDTTRRRHAVTGLVVVLFLAAAAGLGWTWAAMERSSAAFADREVVDGNHLGAGTVDVASGESTALFAARNLAPGDAATGRVELVNGGTLPLRYRLSVAPDGGPLGDVLELAVWLGGPSCADGPTAGGAVWNPSLASLHGSSVSPTLGRLGPGRSQLVCLRAELPVSATSELQGERFEFQLTALAEHDLEDGS